jgi:hypothetical protein
MARKIVGFYILMLLGSSILFAQTTNDEIDTLMEYTGINKQIEQFIAVMPQMFEEQKDKFTDDEYGEVLKIVNAEWSAANLKDCIKDELIKNYDEKVVKSLDKQYQDKLIRDITAQEVADTTPEFEGLVDQFNYETVSDSRKKQIDKMFAVTKELESIKIITKDSIKAFDTTFNLFMPNEKKITPEAEDQTIESTIEVIDSEESILRLKKSDALHYQKFSDDEISRYISFLSSPSGQWVNANLLAGLDKGVKSIMRGVAEKIKAQYASSDSNT